MCISRCEVLQIYEELGIFYWIADYCFCLLTIGERYSLLGQAKRAELERDKLRDRVWGLRERGKKMGRSLAPLDLVKNNDIARR